MNLNDEDFDDVTDVGIDTDLHKSTFKVSKELEREIKKDTAAIKYSYCYDELQIKIWRLNFGNRKAADHFILKYNEKYKQIICTFFTFSNEKNREKNFELAKKITSELENYYGLK